jgi:hypothetical protein
VVLIVSVTENPYRRFDATFCFFIVVQNQLSSGKKTKKWSNQALFLGEKRLAPPKRIS